MDRGGIVLLGRAWSCLGLGCAFFFFFFFSDLAGLQLISKVLSCVFRKVSTYIHHHRINNSHSHFISILFVHVVAYQLWTDEPGTYTIFLQWQLEAVISVISSVGGRQTCYARLLLLWSNVYKNWWTRTIWVVWIVESPGRSFFFLCQFSFVDMSISSPFKSLAPKLVMPPWSLFRLVGVIP